MKYSNRIIRVVSNFINYTIARVDLGKILGANLTRDIPIEGAKVVKLYILHKMLLTISLINSTPNI